MIRVVPLAARHLDAAAALERRCFSEPWSRAALEEELSNPQAVFLAAECGGAFAGYAGMFTAAGEAYAGNVAVEESFRRRGVGAALVRGLAAAARSRGCAFLSLEVRVSNTAARALYESLGFRDMGRRPHFYRAPAEDAEIYTLEFQTGESESISPICRSPNQT